ncbi:EF-hand calcium-binding domain-containing protein 12 [Phascolarctos cinereus]|uniref:EF-hand calcium-binding domain-containing protein 12 n=1 Tax=Phascolarctos cinereus TaxID=38626 RepID=A0A6P5JWX3_PHACI|nr:EF-hand calcium-binding domain-containing protein 12 [Phascolarctos cinereus]
MHSTWFQHFKDSKKPGFKMPQCRHRIIIAPPMPKHVTSECKVTVEAVPSLEVDSSTRSYKTVNISLEEKQVEGRDEVQVWLAQRLKTKRDLDTFVNLEKWIHCKPRKTKSENRVLKKIYRDRGNDLAAQRAAEIASAEITKPVQHVQRATPSLIVPKPSCLSVLYEHLLSQKIKISEMFFKAEWEHQVSREEFLEGMKRVGVPLTEREFEDVVICLGSMNKQGVIYRENLVDSYRCWVAAKKNDSQEKKKYFNYWKRFRLGRQHVKPKAAKISTPPPSTPKLPLLEVPPVNTEPERMHLTYEDMEEVGKRYKEFRRQSKKKINPLVFMEKCRLVRTGNKAYDDHSLPSTLPDEFGEMINVFRRATFLVYLKCVKACEAYKIPLTEKTLMKALLYPGDKLILEKNNVLKLRQPGGYYDEVKEFIPTKEKFHTIEESVAMKKSQRPIKKMSFGEFEVLTRKLTHKSQRRTYSEIQGTHPNFFWPGHLLDKLLLYLPNKKWERQLVLFSRVEKLPHAYPAIYHPDRFWPISDAGYVTYGNFDKHKRCC